MSTKLASLNFLPSLLTKFILHIKMETPLMTLKFPLVAIVLALSSTASAADIYIEGALGFYDADVTTKSYSGVSGVVNVNDLSADLNYDIDPALGFEVGVRVAPQIRVGLAYSKLKLELSDARINGSISDGTTTFSGPVSVTDEEFDSIGVSFDNDVDVWLVNGYYDFKTKGNLKPYVGAGIGRVKIENAKSSEMGYGLSLGANYEINKNFYAGLRGSYVRVTGPTDEIGLEFDDIDLTSVQVLLGYKF